MSKDVENLSLYLEQIKTALNELEPTLSKIENIKDNGDRIATAISKIDTREIDGKLQKQLAAQLSQISEKVQNASLELEQDLSVFKKQIRKQSKSGYKFAIFSMFFFASILAGGGYYLYSIGFLTNKPSQVQTQAQAQFAGQELLKKYSIPLQIMETANGNILVTVKGEYNADYAPKHNLTYIQIK